MSSNKSTERQLTGMAGEFLVAGKLFKLGYQVSITLGNAKSIDLYVSFGDSDSRPLCVQVKTLRKPNCFLIRQEDIKEDHIYVFVMLWDISKQEDYYIITGKEIMQNRDHFFGGSYWHEKPSNMPAINLGPLKDGGYKDRWDIFEEMLKSSGA